ncbi:hypothetical protein MOMUL_07050 [Moorella mulderi DSM 14980]|uniref:Uncharacterized protein n=1 Tax=Moorella mulderi DSM 14980 TaxID=1122241 RepID=A0A151AZU5_9FIRM|nr:hypothetical protein MOMUL_07050 [Moorella mulderi DSM 14980]
MIVLPALSVIVIFVFVDEVIWYFDPHPVKKIIKNKLTPKIAMNFFIIIFFLSFSKVEVPGIYHIKASLAAGPLYTELIVHLLQGTGRQGGFSAGHRPQGKNLQAVFSIVYYSLHPVDRSNIFRG